MSTPPARRRRLLAPVVLALAVASLAACGDDEDSTDTAAGDAAEQPADDETTTTTAGDEVDVEAYCDAAVAIETAPEPDIDFDTATPEEMTAAVQAFATDTLRPLVDDVEANLPPELEEAFVALDAAVTEAAETGDFAAFESPEFEAANDTAHAFDLENCGWEQVDVTAIDYAFEGIPTTVPAGVVNFEFTNQSARQEFHELVLFRINDDVTESVQDLLALPEEEAMTKVTEAGGTGAEPGGSEYTVTELEPGRYGAVCFVPTGASEENPEGTGPPHFMQGMVVEFTVE